MLVIGLIGYGIVLIVNEKKGEYQKRIEQNAMEILELKINDS